MDYEDIYFSGQGGISLHARDYKPKKEQGLPVLCLHGLTRNCRDFEPLIDALPENLGIRFIVPDQRGRGLSATAEPQTYSPIVYAQDMWRLMEYLEVEEFLVIGTSMGGIMALLMSAERPSRIRGIAFNDIGPELQQEELNRIVAYLGEDMYVADWEDAVISVKAMQAKNFPDFTDEQWLAFARRMYTKHDNGDLKLDYDENIGIPVRSVASASVPVNMWSMFETTKNAPILVIRGEVSTLFPHETLTKMKEQHPMCVAIEVPNRGHAPILDEPVAVTNIRSWISRCNGKLM